MPIWLLTFGSTLKGVLSSLFSFFTKKPGVYILAAGVVIFAFWFSNDRSYKNGVKAEKAAAELRLAVAVKAAYQLALVEQDRLNNDLNMIAYNTGLTTGREQARTITLIQKVPTYVSAKADSAFPIPCGLVRMHDAQALHRAPEDLPNPAGLSDDEACPVKASSLTAVLVENYGLYHVAVSQIEGLQDLVKRLASQLSGKSVASLDQFFTQSGNADPQRPQPEFHQVELHKNNSQMGAVDKGFVHITHDVLRVDGNALN